MESALASLPQCLLLFLRFPAQENHKPEQDGLQSSPDATLLFQLHGHAGLLPPSTGRQAHLARTSWHALGVVVSLGAPHPRSLVDAWFAGDVETFYTS